MKKVFAFFFLLATTFIYGQIHMEANSRGSEVNIKPFSYSSEPNFSEKYEVSEMDTAFKLNNVSLRLVNNLFFKAPGFYLISNVFQNKGDVAKNLNKLRKKGFGAGILFDPELQLNYLYLQRFDRWQDALAACKSNVDQTYHKEVWVMMVPNPVVDRESKMFSSPYKNGEGEDHGKIPLEMVSYEMLTSFQNIDHPKRENKSKKSNSWIKRANEYFDKMWYAEAAGLYEKGLEKDPDEYSLEILEKAGDAHYFNGNMKRAHFWYNKIYDSHKEDMDPDYIFKYAHALKGLGKYGRAKRMVRLYNRTMEREGNEKVVETFLRTDANEVVLDQILNASPMASVKNLSLNTEYSEFAPMFYKEDQIVFSSSKDSSYLNSNNYKWSDQPFLNLYVAQVDEEAQDLIRAVKFSNKINTKYHEAAVSFTLDGNTMYFTRNNFRRKLRRDDAGINHLKIYVSKNLGGEWSEPRELPFNSDAYSTGHPALSPDGKKLYFVSDMPGSLGETDIYVVDVLDGGQYSEPKNLGPKINTDRREMFPFISNKRLYFSSDGRIGLGGLDVYEVELGDNGEFMEVYNLGLPINSENDDFSYIVNEETNRGYFASNRKDGKGDDDIYRFERIVPEEAVVNTLAGTAVHHITGEGIPNAVVALFDGNNGKLDEVVTEADGSFLFEGLGSDTEYSVKIVKNLFFDNKALALTKRNETVNIAISMKPMKELIVLEDGILKLKPNKIFFDFDASNINKDAAAELDKLVEVMSKHQDMVIKIESHTDSRGPSIYNQYLSNKRAKASQNYLIANGVSKSRIESAIGYGEDRLINECGDGVRCNLQKHEDNRRSEFIIVKM